MNQTVKTYNPSSLKLILFSEGIKANGGKLTPANFIVDCRGIKERFAQSHALPGENNGKSEQFRADILTHNQGQIQTILDYVLDAIEAIPSRRGEKQDPYSDPFTINFFCAHGVHRSVSTKIMIGERLKQMGYQVEVK